jgi:DNA-directed RNA polymerase specialized sigma24 family protein
MKTRRPTLAAIGRYYEERYHRLLRVAEAIVGDPDLAHDAVQEGFARVIRSRETFRDEGSVEGWIWRTVVNAALDVRTKKLPTGAVPENGREVSNGVGDPVRILIAALPERQRLVLFLRYYADLDYDRIAVALGISPGTVAATLNQAHTRLRSQLEEVHR